MARSCALSSPVECGAITSEFCQGTAFALPSRRTISRTGSSFIAAGASPLLSRNALANPPTTRALFDAGSRRL